MNRKQFFIHIKKTAGTSLVSLIQRNYEWHREILYQASTWREIWRQSPQRLNSAKFIRGHFGINLLKLLPHDIDMFTFLRDPVERCLSDLNFANLTKGHWPHKILKRYKLTARECLSHPQIGHHCKNHLLANLGMDVPLENLWLNRPAIVKTAYKYNDLLDSKECLENAKKHLDACYFVGITEYFKLSYILLCYLNHWRPDLNAEEYHKADKSWIEKTIGKEERNYLTDVNKNDLMLYNYGKKRFFGSLKASFPDLISTLSLDTLSKKEEEKLEKKLYDLTIARHYRSLLNRPVQFKWDASMPLFGCGWHDVHSPKKRPHRWSGPGNFSELDVRLDGACAYRMNIFFHAAMTPDIIRHLNVTVNGQPVRHRISFLKNDFIQLDLIIDKSLQKNGFVSIGFLLPYSISPSSLDPESKDTLKRGIAISRYHLKAA